jgi:hypothetical protein
MTTIEQFIEKLNNYLLLLDTEIESSINDEDIKETYRIEQEEVTNLLNDYYNNENENQENN